MGAVSASTPARDQQKLREIALYAHRNNLVEPLQSAYRKAVAAAIEQDQNVQQGIGTFVRNEIITKYDAWVAGGRKDEEWPFADYAPL